MVVMNSGIKMSGDRHCPRIDTNELKSKIVKKLGLQKSEKYFNLLSRYLSSKLSRPNFNKLCIGLVGRENISLHNGLIRAIIRNACVSKTPPPKHRKGQALLNVKVPDVFPQSRRTPIHQNSKFRDRTSPLGPHGKTHCIATEDSILKVQEQQSATELLSIGSRPPVEVNSVEDGEEVEQGAGSPGIYSKSPVRAPFGVSLNTKGTKKILRQGGIPYPYTETCQNTGMLPDTNSLKKRLEQKMEMEGLSVSTDCVNILNIGLDVFMKRLIKPSLELTASTSEHKLLYQRHHRAVPVLNGMRPMVKPIKSHSLSMLDFRVAMELNPRILGEDWPIELEKICLRASEESVTVD